MVDQLTGLVAQQRLSATRRFFPPRLGQHLVAGYQGNMGQSTHHRLDRLQIVSVGSLRDQSMTQFLRRRTTNKILSCGVIARMRYSAEYFGDTHVEAHHTLICVPLNGIQVKACWLYNLVMTSLTLKRFDLSVLLLILPCWRVFFLGSPTLHNADTDRLQMVGVRSLHVHGAWLLVSSSSRHRQHCSTSKTLEVRYHWDLLCSKLLLQFISESCNKIIEM